MKLITLPIYDIVIKIHDDGHEDAGMIFSSLCCPATDGVESLILAHALAGVDVEDPAYLMGVEVAVEAILNHEED